MPSSFRGQVFPLSRRPCQSREGGKVRKRKPGEESGRTLGRVTPLLGSEGNTERELESSPECVISGRQHRGTYRLRRGQTSWATWSTMHRKGKTKSAAKGAPSGRQGEFVSGNKTGTQAVSWFSLRMSVNIVLRFPLQGQTGLALSYLPYVSQAP